MLAVALINAIRAVQTVAWSGDVALRQVVLVLTAGAFLVGLLVRYWMPEAGGGGVGEVMTSVAPHGGSLGSTIGRVLALNEDQKRALIAGAGIAASFNAPIGGMLFAWKSS